MLTVLKEKENAGLARGERSSIVVTGEPAADDSSFGVSTLMVEGICCGAGGSNSLLGDAGAFISSCIAIVGEEGNIIGEKGAIGASFKS